MTPAESALAEQARADFALLAYPDRSWVKPVPGAADVLVIGGGMTGLAIAQGLRRDGVYNVVALDENPAGQEGVWDSFARMPELRSPKVQSGMDFGQPSLSVQKWFQVKYGMAAWDGINRIPRRDWMDYLRWYRAAMNLPVENDTKVLDIRAGGKPGLVSVETTRGIRYARSVVVATGFEGGGYWRVPSVVSDSLPRDRIGILGHGASAFDAAVVALKEGAERVDLCFRRAKLPTVNPHRHLESAGLMANWPYLPDPIRWNITKHMREFDQPPAHASFAAACAQPDFHMHAGSAWEDVSLDSGDIRVATPRTVFRFDHVICATGYALDLSARPEWRNLAPNIVLWRDRYQPPPEDAWPDLGTYPYLSPGYELQPRDPADDWIGRVHAFNFAAVASMGPHSTSISGQKHALPRLLRALVQRLFLEQQDSVIPDLRAYDEQDIVVPDRFLQQEETANA